MNEEEEKVEEKEEKEKMVKGRWEGQIKNEIKRN